MINGYVTIRMVLPSGVSLKPIIMIWPSPLGGLIVEHTSIPRHEVPGTGSRAISHRDLRTTRGRYPAMAAMLSGEGGDPMWSTSPIHRRDEYPDLLPEHAVTIVGPDGVRMALWDGPLDRTPEHPPTDLVRHFRPSGDGRSYIEITG